MTAPTWDKPYPFDPTIDWPPHGATVTVRNALGGSAFVTGTFHDGRGLWELSNGGVCRPFDSGGITLATAWMEAQRG
jgi:hypothetical protein